MKPTSLTLDQQVALILGAEISPVYVGCKDYYKCSKSKNKEFDCTRCDYYIREGKVERYQGIIETMGRLKEVG